MKNRHIYSFFSSRTIDRIISGGMWRQIFFLLGITALIFLSLGLFGTLMGQDISIEGEDGKPSLL